MPDGYYGKVDQMKRKAMMSESPDGQASLPADMPAGDSGGMPPGVPTTPEEAGLSPEEGQQLQTAIDQANAEMGAEGGGGEDMAVLAEALGRDEAFAQRVYDVAQTHPKLTGKSPAEVGEALKSDYYLKAEIIRMADSAEEQA